MPTNSCRKQKTPLRKPPLSQQGFASLNQCLPRPAPPPREKPPPPRALPKEREPPEERKPPPEERPEEPAERNSSFTMDLPTPEDGREVGVREGVPVVVPR